MDRIALADCLPWLGLLLAAMALLQPLARATGGRLRLGRLARLNRDQSGSAQSLSFVITLPFFVMLILFIVQISQVMIATMVVHYAAFAAARSAVVWIPANAGSGLEPENCISSFAADPETLGQVFPVLDPSHEDYGPGRASEGVTYLVRPSGPKYGKVATAAALACMPVCPSRDVGVALTDQGARLADVVETAYGALAPASAANPKVFDRLRNKLAYALAATSVEIRFFHPNSEPPLVGYPHLTDARYGDLPEFQFNELGWQEPITVKVTHRLALLPGPGRLLARWSPSRVDPYSPSAGEVYQPEYASSDRYAEPYEPSEDDPSRIGEVYVFCVTASATLGNEGEKSVIRYVHELF